VEFPGYVETEEGRAEALEACKQLDAGVSAPWMLLSAGVGYEAFKTQVEIACRAGASGFMAGRSIWRDAASTHDPKKRESAAKDAVSRLSELASVTRRHGRPFAPKLEGKDCGFCWRHYWLPAHWAGGQSFSRSSVGPAIRLAWTQTRGGFLAQSCYLH